MVRYYVTSDVHGYYTKLKNALTEKGFFDDPQPHKLVVCGDLFDRGQEALLLQEFIVDLMKKDQVILIKGNHEELAMDLLHKWNEYSFLQRHHHLNGTVDTVCQLTGFPLRELLTNPTGAGRAFLRTPYVRMIIPATRDYFETDHYVFVHGWIPCDTVEQENGETGYLYIPGWRDAGKAQWRQARWCNGMAAANCGVIENDKDIVCGHWNCSFGHSRYHGLGSEFAHDAHFEPYYDEGIIALDACTAHSGILNCIVIED